MRQVWIASHIHNVRQLNFLRDAIRSIENQTIKPDQVLMSCSIQRDIRHLRQDVSQIFKTTLSIPFHILFQEERMYQFEHLEKIKDHVVDHDDVSEVRITFLDDDDFLHEDYMRKTQEFLEYDKIKCLFYLMLDDIKYENRHESMSSVSSYSEYGGMTCSLEYFLSFLQSDFYRPDNEVADIYLNVFRDPRFRETIIPQPLYYYRKHLHTDNLQLWRFPKEITESQDYYELIDLLKDLEPSMRTYILLEWLYFLRRRRTTRVLSEISSRNVLLRIPLIIAIKRMR